MFIVVGVIGVGRSASKYNSVPTRFSSTALLDVFQHADDGEPRDVRIAALPQAVTDRALAWPERARHRLIDEHRRASSASDG